LIFQVWTHKVSSVLKEEGCFQKLVEKLKIVEPREATHFWSGSGGHLSVRR